MIGLALPLAVVGLQSTCVFWQNATSSAFSMTTTGRQLHTWIHTTTRHSVGDVAHVHKHRAINSLVTRHVHRISKPTHSKSDCRASVFGSLTIPYAGYRGRRFTNLVTTDAQRQTIYALSTPAGKGGVAIVRISGPDALEVWKRMLRSHSSDKPIRDPTPWKLQRCRIVHPENGSLIDDGLAVYFRGMLILCSIRSVLILNCSSLLVYDTSNCGTAYSLW